MEKEPALKNTIEKENSSIFIPDIEDFNVLSIKELHFIWRENHKKLLSLLSDVDIPFFALHGTSYNSYLSILNSNSSLHLATLEKKDKETEKLLYHLYKALLYTVPYAIGQHRSGRILILNVEMWDTNPTAQSKLYYENILAQGLTVDSKTEKEMLSSKNEDLFAHGFWMFYSDKIKDQLLGVIKVEDLKSLSVRQHVEGIALIYLNERFLAQAMAFKTIEILKNTKTADSEIIDKSSSSIAKVIGENIE